MCFSLVMRDMLVGSTMYRDREQGLLQNHKRAASALWRRGRGRESADRRGARALRVGDRVATPAIPVPIPNDGDLMDPLLTWARDRETMKRILVNNPVRFYGFI
jgi:hypothetical protein